MQSIALSLEKLLTFPPTEIEDQELFFTAVVGGVDGVEVELVPGGKRLAVDSSNVHQYVEAYSRHLMVGSCKAGLVAMRAGLLDVVPESALELLTAEDMTLILHGSGGIALNMGALKERTAVNFAIEVTADEATKYEDMLWAVIAEFSDADRRQVCIVVDMLTRSEFVLFLNDVVTVVFVNCAAPALCHWKYKSTSRSGHFDVAENIYQRAL